jgi:hypothetical protein
MRTIPRGAVRRTVTGAGAWCVPAPPSLLGLQHALNGPPKRVMTPRKGSPWSVSTITRASLRDCSVAPSVTLEDPLRTTLHHYGIRFAVNMAER